MEILAHATLTLKIGRARCQISYVRYNPTTSAVACMSLSTRASVSAANLLRCRQHVAFNGYRPIKVKVGVLYPSPALESEERNKPLRSRAQHRYGTSPVCSASYDGGASQEYNGSERKVTEIQAVELHVTPGVPPEPSRLDAYLTANSPEVSRARIVTTIKAGLVDVNGKVMKKPAYKISSGDHIRCKILAPPLLEALPEDIPLDVRYEDEHLLVINKPAQMVRT